MQQKPITAPFTSYSLTQIDLHDSFTDLPEAPTINKSGTKDRYLSD